MNVVALMSFYLGKTISEFLFFKIKNFC